jgi:DNA-binding NtrC family response regulator
VVISGEDGTGRGLLATYIHTRSARALGPMVVVDCRRAAAHVEEMLFGRGSAPGLPPSSSALLKADGGSLVLLDVDSLPRASAERLGRLISKKAAPARRGGEEPVDVRIIATSAHSVSVMAQRSELEPDLAKALTGIEIEQLPLRERKQDVLQLFEHFAMSATKATRKDMPSLSPDARRLLSEYHWPGNIEELRGVSERLALLYAGTEVPALRLPPEIQEGPSATSRPRSLAEMIARLERDAIAEALRETRGKKIKAATLLGISRPTLDKKIEDYHLVVEKRR